METAGEKIIRGLKEARATPFHEMKVYLPPKLYDAAKAQGLLPDNAVRMKPIPPA